MGKFFSETRLSLPLLPSPQLISVRGERLEGQEVTVSRKTVFSVTPNDASWGLSVPFPATTSVICPRGGKRLSPEYSLDQPSQAALVHDFLVIRVLSSFSQPCGVEGKLRQRGSGARLLGEIEKKFRESPIRNPMMEGGWS